MAKPVLIILFLFSSCTAFQVKRQISSLENEVISCSIVKKGCILKRNSETLIIFFRGWVPHTRFGSRKVVPERNWGKAAYEMLSKGSSLGGDVEKALGEVDLESSIFAMASSHLDLSMDEMDKILEYTGAKKIIFASHSGGQKGLRQTLLAGTYDYWNEKVAGIWLLDTHYSAAITSQVISRNLGKNHKNENFLRDNCFGYVTDHNWDNYKIHYRNICPNTISQGVSHGNGVTTCLPYFEKGESCTP